MYSIFLLFMLKKIAKFSLICEIYNLAATVKKSFLVLFRLFRDVEYRFYRIVKSQCRSGIGIATRSLIVVGKPYVCM
jgi:hypothetical protein